MLHREQKKEKKDWARVNPAFPIDGWWCPFFVLWKPFLIPSSQLSTTRGESKRKQSPLNCFTSRMKADTWSWFSPARGVAVVGVLFLVWGISFSCVGFCVCVCCAQRKGQCHCDVTCKRIIAERWANGTVVYDWQKTAQCVQLNRLFINNKRINWRVILHRWMGRKKSCSTSKHDGPRTNTRKK